MNREVRTMPSINRIRVNNVKYNFGTQGYDDFSMRMYGRNTLYDLANGGGKSVLMLLLMQNLIPNCTLDDKQPIEKLFRDSSNTVIHSLIEWKLDECDVKEGLRYMTTGFAAKKAATTDEEREDGTAQIEYFNYCIFYRDYNKNDIVNLPLVKDNEHISYKALRNYLHDLARNDKNMYVQIFDRKGEYQRFIAKYGLYESHWEIIRGINKTEGHVRTYFETNYKTTRRVVEDLLIEEIIEKAYLAKTERETDKTESTVSLLMTIQEELKTLAEKKKGIQLYDHERELVQLLIDRIESFMALYGRAEEAALSCGRIFVTLEAEKKNREVELDRLGKCVSDAEKLLMDTRKLLDMFLVARQVGELDSWTDRLKENETELEKLNQERQLQDEEFRRKQAISEYLVLKDAKEKLDNLNRAKEAGTKDAHDIVTIVANIRDRYDLEKESLTSKLEPYQKKLEETRTRLESLKKQKIEGETEIAVIDSRISYIKESYDAENERIKESSEGLSHAMLGSPADLTTELEKNLAGYEKELQGLEQTRKADEEKLASVKKEVEEGHIELELIERDIEIQTERVESYRQNKGKFRSISRIYTGNEAEKPDKVEERLSDRTSSTIVKIYEMKQKLARLNAREKSLREGQLIEPTEAVEKIREYLTTRHNMNAMFGMDYISALPEDMRERILRKLPGIPYGIIVNDLNKLVDDPGLMQMDINEEIVLYDKDTLDSASVISGEGVHFVRHDREFFTDPKSAVRKLSILGDEINVMTEEIRSNEESLETLREDLDFVRLYIAQGYGESEQELENLRIREREKTRELQEKEKLIRDISSELEQVTLNKEKLDKKVEVCLSDISVLGDMVLIQRKLTDLSSERDRLVAEKKRIENVIRRVNDSVSADEISILEQSALCEGIENKIREMDTRWDTKYSPYFVEDTPFPALDMKIVDLENAFDSALGENAGEMSPEKDRLLRETLMGTIDRETRTISELGISIDELAQADSKGEILVVSEDIISSLKNAIQEMKRKIASFEAECTDIRTKQARIEGSIEYAKTRLRDTYGEEAEAEFAGLEIPENIEDKISSLKAALEIRTQEVENARHKLKEYSGQARTNDDLLRLASRIVENSGIDISNVDIISDTEGIREEFEDILLKVDSLNKEIDRAKADMLKVKMKVYDSLSNMNVTELAASIRDDVIIPENKRQAEELLKRLSSVTEIITLEKERIEKSLVSMEQLKDNFVDQCVERCLDVRTELDKLTKLSEISLEDTKVQMIRLSIPYVKDEFIKDRMSEYIDRIVEEVDKKESDSERLKLLNMSLSMKKMFSVIVTDMSKIRMLLYKRERIKEQSRYLRYEEAVGSTGQSQGIYIQFLISIINYIAGMYEATDSTSRAKTLFIDNPFGAAKDIYIWEPIFKLLEENHCQLIVPARGATPEITGRFDINYVLGQQMTGNRTTTVVVDFSSKTKGEELEYKDLDFEQQTFDFI